MSMDNLDLFPDFDVLTDPLTCDLDLTMPEVSGPTPDELRAISRLLPADFGQRPSSTPAHPPARSSLTCFTEKISIRIPRAILAIIKGEATRRGLRYQTFMNMMLNEAAAGRMSI